MSETPMLFTDLLSPSSLAKHKKENPHAPYVEENDVIPIKTWTTGSPLAKKHQFRKDELQDIPEGVGMDKYFAKAFGDPTDEENAEEENEEQNYEEEDEGDNQVVVEDEEDGEPIKEMPDYMESGVYIEGYDEFEFDADYEDQHYTTDDCDEDVDDQNAEIEEEGDYEEEYEQDDQEVEEDGGEEEYEDDYQNDEEEGELHESEQENNQPLFDDLIGLINSYEEMKEEVFRESQNLKQSKSKEGTTVTTPSRLSSEDALRLAEQLEQEDDEDTTSIVNEYKDLLAYLTSPAKNAELTEFSQEGANHLFDNDFDIFPSAPTKKSVKVIEKPVKQRPLQPQQHEVPVKTKKSVQPSHPANKNKQNNLFYAPGQKASLVEDQQQSKQRQRYEENDDDLDYENEVARLVKVPKSVSHHLLDEKKGKKKNKNGKKVDHRKFYGAEVVVKKSHPLIKNHGPDKAKLLEAQRRHRDMLANMVNKRKAEEEELLALAAKAQEKRKRFKESLLEKASKARKDHDEVSEEEASPVADHRPAPVQKAVFATQAALPHHHSPSAAQKHQIIPTNRKTTNQVIADAEEIAKQEEEKREHVAAIRRKFKEQHKKLLLSLMLKKKEEELMEEQQQILDQIKKEKRKKKIAKMLSEKGHGSETPEKHLNKEGDDNKKPSAKKSEGKAQVAVGSAIQAIRQRAQSNPDSMNQNAAENSKVKKNVGKPIAGRPRKLLSEEIRSDDSEQEPTSSHNKMAEEKQRRAKAKREREEEIVIEDEGEGEENPEEIQKKLELLEAKRQFSLQQSKKIAAYLSALTEQKKKEEEEKKKKEDRQKKRIILLSQRLLKEANERKLMILEDKPNYREIYLKKNSCEVEELEKTLPARRRGSGGAPVQEGEKKKKITPEMAESIAARLSKKSNVTFEADQVSSAPIKEVRPPRPAPSNKDSNSSDDNNDGAPPAKHTNPPIPTITPTVMIYRDFNDWKRKNNVPPDARVFCMTGWYPCVKQALIDRGWHFNPDPASPYCHLKWTLRSVDVNQDTLQPWQLTNHYCKNVAITTKAGLIKSLQSLIWMANVDINDIIPRAYDLTIQDDMISFLEDYKNLKAEGILKKLYSQATGLESLITDNPSDYRPLSSSVGTSGGALSSSPLREAKKLSPTTNDDSAGEEDEEGEEKAKERVPITVIDGNDHVEGESAKPFDLNDFLLPSIPLLPESVYANPLPTILINGAIFEITCQHLESQLKPFNIGGNSTAKKSLAKVKLQRRGSGQSNTLSHTKSSNQFEEDEVSEVIASGNCENDGDDEEDDINVCDYDYCPSGYHEVNIHASTDIYTSGNAGNPANNNNYTTGVHPYINYPRSVIQGIKLVSDLHWEIIDSYSIYERVASLPFDAPEPLDQFLRGSGGNNSSSTADDEYDEITGKKYTYQQLQREKRRLMKIYEEHREEITNLMNQPLRPLTIQDIERIHKLLYQRLLYYYGKNQSLINGNDYHGYNNLWIVKPAAKSRGRGIMTFSNINKLLKYIEAGNGLSTQWIVQKYIENSLIIAKRKFDLRQWILVTSWNPLTIYFYNECYARFSVDEYSANTTSLENSYIHLVNNSIGKNSENFNKIITAENNESIEGYMWDYQSFSKYLQWSNANHENIMDKKIQPRMKEIAIYALMCASDSIEHRKNSWELYGFDFMIDDQYNTWLIEINSSPACDYSTKVTERYVQKALVELLNVVLDVREWEAQPKKQRTGEKPDTGGWECIYQGPTLDLPIGSFGADISVKGESVKGLPKRSTSYSLPVVIPANPSGASSAMNSAVNVGDLSVVSIGANQPSDSFSATNSGSGSRSTSIKKMMAKSLIKPAASNSTVNGNIKPTIPKPNASNNRQTKPTHVNRQAHDEVLTLDDEDDDLSVATNDKFRHDLSSANGGGLSQRSNSSQPDLTSQTYDDSSDDHQGGGTSGRSSKKQGGVANKASVVHPSSNVPNLAIVGNAPPLKKEGSVVNKAAAAVAAIPIKTFNVDF